MTPEISSVNAEQFAIPMMGSELVGFRRVFLCAGYRVKINHLNSLKSLYISTHQLPADQTVCDLG